MKKILLCIGCFYSLYAVDVQDLTVKNECPGLLINNLQWGLIEKDWQGERSTELRYGLKNTTDNVISNIKATVYLKNDNGNRIYEKVYGNNDLKAHYVKPVNNRTYWGISPLPAEFMGKADMEVTCNTTNKKQKKPTQETANRGGMNFYISEKKLNKIKEGTVNKTELEARMSIGLLIHTLAQSGGIDEFKKKMCSNK